MKSAVVNKETTVVENMIMAGPSDPWSFSNTFLVLVPDNLPVNIGFTYIEPSFYDLEGNIVTLIEYTIEEIIEEVDNGS
jgi:hypothetical protein